MKYRDFYGIIQLIDGGGGWLRLWKIEGVCGLDIEDAITLNKRAFGLHDEHGEINTLESVQNEQGGVKTSKRDAVERRFLLLRLLTFNDCTREDIFERLHDYYHSDGIHYDIGTASSRSIERMFARDIEFLEKMKYEVGKQRRGRGEVYYRIVKGPGLESPFLLDKNELEALVLLHTLFADPTKYTRSAPAQPLPIQPPRNPFAEDIQVFIERLVKELPSKQKREFDRQTRKPFVYLNMDTVTDYLPHVETIDTIVKAISLGRQIRFEYGSLHRQSGTTPHREVDPYYIVHQEGHLYLMGYAHNWYSSALDKFFEFRIDRISADSVEILPTSVDMERRRKPIEFRYWADESIARGGLSQRWLFQEIEREEMYVESASGRQRRRLLVRAQAYNDFRIIQQLHKYGDKVELIDPPELREKMRLVVERLYKLYNNE